MNILTQVIVNKTEAARKRFSDTYTWHKALWQSFPGKDRQARNFLFRIDDAGRNFKVLLLSNSEPTDPGWGNWHSKMINKSFLDYSAYRFQLKANPSMRRCADRRRIGIYGEEKLHSWITRKAEQNGFAIINNSLIIGNPIDVTFIRNKKRGKHVSVDFQGGLEVTDKTAFKEAFTKGIGSAKSFGYGMLTLQPLSH